MVIGALAGAAHAQVESALSQPFYGKPAYGYSEHGLRLLGRQLLGWGYSETDSVAVQRCAAAAMQQAAVQYEPQPSGDEHPHGQGYNPAALLRITAISAVQRGENGLRVSGLIDTRFGHPPYGRSGGYVNNGYAAAGELSFRCNIGFSGMVSKLRVDPSSAHKE
jgi:hypothetical protein